LEHTWIFDLDNTLHDAEQKIFPIINQKINRYISKELKINLDNADQLRQKYWDQYGATLEGLIKHHKINPNKFLEETHKVDNLETLVVPMPNLKNTLASLKGLKILYTNAPKNYTKKILKKCDIEDYFDSIFSIEDANFKPKPSKVSMQLFINKYKIKKAYFVDDIKENLETAHDFGLFTIWLSNQKEDPKFIDKKISQLSDLVTN